MPLSKVKITVTRCRQVAVPVDQVQRLQQLQHHQMAENVHQTAVDHATAVEPATPGTAQDPEKPPTKHEPHALQSAFLSKHRNRQITVYLMNGVKLVGNLRQFDPFTILLEGPDGINAMTFKHTIASIVPASQ